MRLRVSNHIQISTIMLEGLGKIQLGRSEIGIDQFNPVALAVHFDEVNHHFHLRSSFAWAKKADALRGISSARMCSRFSRSRALICSRSDVVNPAREPVSRSAWRTLRRNVSGVQPILDAIDSMAAHCEPWDGCCSETIRTTRSQTSGEYRICFVIAVSSQIEEPPAKSSWFSLGVGEDQVSYLVA